MVSMKTMDVFSDLPFRRINCQVVPHMDAFHDQHVAILFEFSRRVSHEQSLTGGNLARLQRTSERAGQSACRRRNEIIEGSRVGGVNRRINPVMFRDFRMNAKEYRLVVCRQVRPAQRPFDALNPHIRSVDNMICHSGFLLMFEDHHSSKVSAR
jgi:hypothetical protein